MPTNICYISCHPQTMMRDLQKIKELEAYEISDVVLLDLFPSTFHFEALITLKKS
jgi:tRNA/tmRNA/rRNA uracil-C5-methylase (TrmA/RlmC/RlmD family)